MKLRYRHFPGQIIHWVIIVLVIFLAGCGQLTSTGQSTFTQASSTHATSSPRLNLTIIVDRTVTTLSNVCDSPLVVAATVSQILPGEWKDHSQGAFSIVTPILLTQLHILADHRTGPTSEIVMAGGQVGGDRIRVLGFPRLASHQRYLLFLMAGRGQWMYVFDAFRINAQQMVSLPLGRDAHGIISYQQRQLSLQQLAHLLAPCHE